MDKNDVLAQIFANDPLNILEVKSRSERLTTDQRLVSSFQEINEFCRVKCRTPKANESDISEFQLYQRLHALRENSISPESLKQYD